MHLPRCLEAAPKRFVSGETLPYLGRNVRLIAETAEVRAPKVRFDHWRFRVTIPKTLDEYKRYERIRRAIVTWYRDRASERLPTVVERWWPRLGRGEVTTCSCPRPASALGELRARRHVAIQLAGHDAETGVDRVHRSPRTCAPDPPQPLIRLLEPSGKSNAGRSTTPKEPA